MDARRSCPLFLLLLVWAFSTRVQCQELTANLVFTRYVEVSWLREVAWVGVKDFQVQFTAEGSNTCSETIECQSVNCSFSSLLCGVVAPCTPTTTTVTGSGYSAQLSLVTGPEEVTDLDMYLDEGVEYFSWVNPSINSSTCHEKTAIRVSISGRESISYLDSDEEEADKPLCVEGEGQVEVWTLGGDGRSKSVLGNFDYTDYDDVVDLVTFEKCEPVGCTDMALEWTYNPLCPEVAYLQVAVDDDVQQNLSTGDTNVTVTGLEVDERYSTCIRAMDKDGIVLFSACQSCATADEVPENLAAQPLHSQSLNVTWDPPLCTKYSEKIQYKLRIDYSYYTYDNTYEVTGLSSFKEYEVEVQVYHSYEGTTVTTTAFTLAPQPDLYYPYVNKDNIELHWYFYVSDDHGYKFYFKVTWGKSLEHEGETMLTTYTIEDYDSIDDVYQVCVAAVPKGRENLTSEADCRFVSEKDINGGLSDGAIAGIVCAVVACVVVVAVVAVSITKKRKDEARRRQQQRQQQQQQQQQQQEQQQLQERYNNGIYNYDSKTCL